MKLQSKRLQCIANCIQKYKNGNILADIGTDHAYLPCFLYLNNIIDKAYACDIADGPLAISKKTIDMYQCKDVYPLKGSGLDPIIDKDVDMISICGMGGLLVRDILDAYPDYLKNHLFILQANTAINVLREYLFTHNMMIIDEELVKDGHHIYEVIVCQYGHQDYNDKDILFGPCLRRKKGPLYLEKWSYQLKIYQNILSSLQPTHDKYQETIDTIHLIEGELSCS